MQLVYVRKNLKHLRRREETQSDQRSQIKCPRLIAAHSRVVGRAWRRKDRGSTHANTKPRVPLSGTSLNTL